MSGNVENWAFENSSSQKVGNRQTSHTEDQGIEAVPAADENDKADAVAVSSARALSPSARNFWTELR